MIIRKGKKSDVYAISDIYNSIHDAIERGQYNMKWYRDRYPTREWAEEHISAGDLYVLQDADNEVVASAIINHNPLPEYFAGRWYQPDNYEKILIIHTLVVRPDKMHRGYATALINYYEKMAIDMGCERLRLDTQAIDIPARQLYRKLGYIEADYLPCQFKGINDIDLVLIEKILTPTK